MGDIGLLEDPPAPFTCEVPFLAVSGGEGSINAADPFMWPASKDPFSFAFFFGVTPFSILASLWELLCK
jgi:hypothetical protein